MTDADELHISGCLDEALEITIAMAEEYYRKKEAGGYKSHRALQLAATRMACNLIGIRNFRWLLNQSKENEQQDSNRSLH